MFSVSLNKLKCTFNISLKIANKSPKVNCKNEEKIWEFQWHIQSGYLPTASRLNLNLEVLVFVEGVLQTGYQEKNPWSRDENQQQTQPTYGVKPGMVGSWFYSSVDKSQFYA